MDTCSTHYVVITRQYNPSISEFDRPCNECTSIKSITPMQYKRHSLVKETNKEEIKYQHAK